MPEVSAKVPIGSTTCANDIVAASAKGVIAMTRRHAASALGRAGKADVVIRLDAAEQHAGRKRRPEHAADVEPGLRIRLAARQAMRQRARECGARGIAAIRQESERRAGLLRERRRRGAQFRETRMPHGEAAEDDRRPWRRQ